jgi:hypothetical protein
VARVVLMGAIMISLRTRSSSHRFAVALAAVATTLGSTSIARAQNVALSFPPTQFNPYWLDSSSMLLNGGEPIRQAGHNPYGVSFSDCENDLQLQFAVAVTYPAGTTGTDSLQVWAGTSDCSVADSRATIGGIPGVCVPVSAPIVLNSSSLTVSVYARDLAMAIGGASPAGTGGVATFSSVHATSDASCFRQVGSAPVSFYLYFLAFKSGGTALDSSISYNAPLANGGSVAGGMAIDLVGPIAPEGGAIARGDRDLTVSWAPASDADTQGFQVFCDPTPSGSTPPLASDAGSASVPAAGGGTCQSPLASYADGSKIPPAYDCSPQLAGTTNDQYVASSLVDGEQYTFAVAGFDAFDNIGAVAVVGCADPEIQPSASTEAGSTGGGGCAVSGGSTQRPLAASVGLGVVALVLARRKRSGRRSNTVKSA